MSSRRDRKVEVNHMGCETRYNVGWLFCVPNLEKVLETRYRNTDLGNEVSGYRYFNSTGLKYKEGGKRE